MQLTRSCFRISDGVFEAFTVFFPPVTLRLRCDCFRDHHTCKVVSSSLQCISITQGSSRTSSSELQFTSPPSLKMIISTPVTFLPYLHWSLILQRMLPCLLDQRLCSTANDLHYDPLHPIIFPSITGKLFDHSMILIIWESFNSHLSYLLSSYTSIIILLHTFPTFYDMFSWRIVHRGVDGN